MKYCVVVVGYNRPDSMKRLLISLTHAKYDKPCDMIVSLDFGKMQPELISIAENVKWEHGEKKIRAFQENQGLRNHILQCGDLTKEYDVVIVLEDDLVVAESFFQYAVEAVSFYKGDDNIAGISLYTHRTNPGNGRPFEAQFNGYDVFLMQYAQSWGQCWTRKMWEGFRSWYDAQPEEVTFDGVIPDYVTRWNCQSWLKYYIRYTAEKNMFWIYPYFSMTTNSSEVGEHNDQTSNAYQVPLAQGTLQNFRFPSVSQAIMYDSYFERMESDGAFGFKGKVMLDLYGLRTHFEGVDVLISTQILPYEVLEEIALKYRPQEHNLWMREKGKGIYVYDITKPAEKKSKKAIREEKFRLVQYDLKAESPRMTLLHGLNGIKNSLRRRLKK